MPKIHLSNCASLTKMLTFNPPKPAPCDCGALDDTPRFLFVEEPAKPKGPLDKQIGGNHYKIPIQPVEYIYKNGIGFFEGNVIKYVTRWRDKGGIADLEKAKHYIEMLIEFERDLASR